MCEMTFSIRETILQIREKNGVFYMKEEILFAPLGRLH